MAKKKIEKTEEVNNVKPCGEPVVKTGLLRLGKMVVGLSINMDEPSVVGFIDARDEGKYFDIECVLKERKI